MNLVWIVILLSVVTGTDIPELATALALENELLAPQPNQNQANAEEFDEALAEKRKQLKISFGKDLVATLSREKCIKSFEMTIEDPIEKRAINRVQIEHLIDILSNNKRQANNYYNYRKSFCVKTINEVKYLHSNQTEEEQKR